MPISKLRAAVIVFLVGFALGISVFAASRLFVRSVLNGDAVLAARELAANLAAHKPIGASGALSSVVRYTYFDRDGNVIDAATPGQTGTEQPEMSADERAGITGLAAKGGAVLEDVPLLPSLLGLADSAVKRVAVPVVANGEMIGSLFVEVNQARALASLTRAFSVVAMVTIGLAVLAVIVVAFVVTRGRGFRERKVFDPSVVARDPLTGVPSRAGFVEVLDDARGARGGSRPAGAPDDRRPRPFQQRERHLGQRHRRQGAANGRRAAAALRHAGRPVWHAPPATSSPSSWRARRSIPRISSPTRSARRSATPFEIAGASIIISASIGAALYPINAEGGDMLFRAACSALAKAKAQGRNALAVFDTEMKERMQRNEALERDLRNALDGEEFVVFYQPQLELTSGRVRGYEALDALGAPGRGNPGAARFPVGGGGDRPHPPDRRLGPAQGLRGRGDLARFRHGGGELLRRAVPHAGDRQDHRRRRWQETGLPAERLEIEVPESLFLDCTPEIMETLKRIKALGVRVAMDDFGSGYSGLASLAHFPFDKIKIDRSFVGQLTEDADVAAIVASIVTLGRTLSVDVTAEGVETSEQVTLLKAAGCSIVQGFLFGMPQRGCSASRRKQPTPPQARTQPRNRQSRRSRQADRRQSHEPEEPAAKCSRLSRIRGAMQRLWRADRPD